VLASGRVSVKITTRGTFEGKTFLFDTTNVTTDVLEDSSASLAGVFSPSLSVLLAMCARVH
jgi:hypothetical protein